MQYTKTHGKTVPAMTLGTVQLGLNYGIANQEGKPSREKSFAMLRAALASGVSAWDTAQGYGDSEMVIGEFLARDWQGERPLLTTKCTLNAPDGSPDADVERELTEQVEKSLARLGVDKVDYLLLHDAKDMLRLGGSLSRALARLMKEGYFDVAGVSVYYATEIAAMLEEPLYGAIQIPMGVLDQRLIHDGCLQRLHSRGVDVFVRSVFQQGLCFMDADDMEEELRCCAAVPVDKLRALAERCGMTVAQFAVSFIRDLPGVTSLVLGADNPEQVRQNAALIGGPGLPPDFVAEALDAFKDVDYEAIMTVLRRGRSQA